VFDAQATRLSWLDATALVFFNGFTHVFCRYSRVHLNMQFSITAVPVENRHGKPPLFGVKQSQEK